MTTKEDVVRLMKLGMRREDIAARVGVSVPTIYRWARGVKPHFQFAKKLEEFLAEVEARSKKQVGN